MEGVENSPMNNRQKQVPIRYALLVPFIVLMAVSVGLISHISFSNSREAVNDVAGRLRQEISTRIKEHLDSFLKIPHTITKSAEDVIYQGLLDPGDPDALIKYFQSRVSAYPSISSAYFGNPRGGLADSGRTQWFPLYDADRFFCPWSVQKIFHGRARQPRWRFVHHTGI